MAVSRIDELNILNDEPFDYKDFTEHYFDTMQITEKQRKERIEAAEDLFNAILLFLIWCDNAPERVQEEETQRSFENMYKEVIYQYGEPDDYFDRYVHSFIPYLIKVTLEHKGDKFFTSVERAAFNACNESNTVLNHVDLENAKELGYKNKTWVAEIDDRTRADHVEMNGWTIPIDDYFVFEDCMMTMPHDYVHGTQQQLANCRCSLRFS